ncbi:MAG: Ppx/GppA phosphatase family protein [Alphaproteobacteria bacterium]
MTSRAENLTQQGGRSGEGRWGHVYAAVDLGTNNCRLLVAKPARHGFQVIDSFSRIVRLGEGLSARSALSESAMRRTIEALKICGEKMARKGVTRQRHVATAACRSADNHEEFVDRVRRETGVRLEVISAREEARLAVAGCVSLFDDGSDHAFIFDIGGGSTELIWTKISPDRQCEILAWTSLHCGVVTLAELFGGHTVGREAYAAMVRYVEDQLAPFDQRHNLADTIAQRRVQMIGTSGTVTTVAGVHLGLSRYDRNRVDGMWISRDDVYSVSHKLAEMTYEERVANPCIGHDRADLVVAGCAIYEAIANTWPSDRLRVADRGLREGLLLDLMASADQEAARGPNT